MSSRISRTRFRIFHTRLGLEESSSHRINRSIDRTARLSNRTPRMLYLRRVFRFTFGFHRPISSYSIHLSISNTRSNYPLFERAANQLFDEPKSKSSARGESESRHVQGEPVLEEQRHEYLEVLYILGGWTLGAHVVRNLRSLLRYHTRYHIGAFVHGVCNVQPMEQLD